MNGEYAITRKFETVKFKEDSVKRVRVLREDGVVWLSAEDFLKACGKRAFWKWFGHLDKGENYYGLQDMMYPIGEDPGLSDRAYAMTMISAENAKEFIKDNGCPNKEVLEWLEKSVLSIPCSKADINDAAAKADKPVAETTLAKAETVKQINDLVTEAERKLDEIVKDLIELKFAIGETK